MSKSGHTWRGVPIEDLSREELERAVIFLASRVAGFYTDDAIETRVAGKLAIMKQTGSPRRSIWK